MDTSSFSTCLFIAVLVALLVVVMPAVDRLYCRKVGLSPLGGKNRTLKSNRAYVFRRIILYLVCAIYLAGFLYVTFLSRSASEDYQVHTELFKNLVDSLIDFGVLGWIINLVSHGVTNLPTDLPSLDFSGITQFLLNIMLFIPLGYLLPYLFRWFRKDVRIKMTVTAFLVSLCVENVQLVTKLGYYDLDDLVTNTFGGWVGASLYLAYAFWVLNPDWRKNRKWFKKWKKNAKANTLYPYTKGTAVTRTFLQATDETSVWEFYVKKLGFRVVKQLVPEDKEGTVFLLEMGNYQLEILCYNTAEILGEQHLILSAKRPEKVRKRLENNGISVSPYDQDPFSGQSVFRFDAPDGVKVIVLAQDE